MKLPQLKSLTEMLTCSSTKSQSYIIGTSYCDGYKLINCRAYVDFVFNMYLSHQTYFFFSDYLGQAFSC